MEWFGQTFRKVHHGFAVPEWAPEAGQEFDAEAYVRIVKESRADCIEFYAKDHMGNAAYATRLGKRCKTGRDYLGELLVEARRAGLRVIAYYSALWDRAAGETHPDWVQLNSRGERIKHNTWWQLCPNSGYRDQVFGQLQELSRYDVDGVFLDMFVFGNGSFPPAEASGCFCARCAQSFREQYGLELPFSVTPGSPEAKACYEWRSAQIEEFLCMCRRAVKGTNPRLLFSINVTHSLVGDFSSRLYRLVDVISLEAYPEIPLWMPGSTHLTPSIAGKYAQSFDKPSELFVSRFGGAEWFNWTTKNEEQLALEVYSCIAVGASPTVIDFPFPEGTLEPAFYKMLGRIYTEVEKLEPWLADCSLLADYAVLYSEESVNYGGPARHQEAFFAACKSLVENHLLFQAVVPAKIRQLEAKVLIIPEANCLSWETIDEIEAFVRRGGKVLFTHESSMFDENGSRNTRNLNHFFEIEEEGTIVDTECFVIVSEITKNPEKADYENEVPHNQGCRTDPGPVGPLLIRGGARLVRSRRGMSFFPLLMQAARIDWDHPLQNACGWPKEPAGFDCLLLFDGGAYVSAPLFSNYASQGEPSIARTLSLILHQLATPSVEVKAPPGIEIVVHRKAESGLIVHLLNHMQSPGLPGRWQPRFGQTAIKVEVRFADEMARVRCLPDLTEVAVKADSSFETEVSLHKALLVDLASERRG